MQLEFHPINQLLRRTPDSMLKKKDRKGWSKIGHWSACTSKMKTIDVRQTWIISSKSVVSSLSNRSLREDNNRSDVHDASKNVPKSVRRRKTCGRVGLTRQSWEQGPLKLLGPRGRRLLLLVSLAETTFTAKCICSFCCKASTHVEQQTGKAICENDLL